MRVAGTTASSMQEQSLVSSWLHRRPDREQRRRVEVLEQMARAIYREWFVNFRYPGHEDVHARRLRPGPDPGWLAQSSCFDAADVEFRLRLKSTRFGSVGAATGAFAMRDVPRGCATCTDERPLATGMHCRRRRCAHRHGWRLPHVSLVPAVDAWLNQRVTQIRPSAASSARHALCSAHECSDRQWNRADRRYHGRTRQRTTSRR